MKRFLRPDSPNLRNRIKAAAGGFLVMLCHAGLSLQAQQGYSLEEALKVLRLIEKVQEEQLEGGSRAPRHVTVTESELNSYIAFRIDREEEKVLRELRFKLFDKNRIEGKVVVDLRESQDLPKFFKPNMTFYMGGELEVRDGKVRLNLKDLFLEHQRIQPMVLDLAIFLGSKILNSEPWSIQDWWDLPYGIKGIRTFRGRAVFTY